MHHTGIPDLLLPLLVLFASCALAGAIATARVAVRGARPGLPAHLVHARVRRPVRPGWWRTRRSRLWDERCARRSARAWAERRGSALLLAQPLLEDRRATPR